MDKKELNYLNEQKLECRDDLRTLEKMVWIKDMDDAVLDKPRLSVFKSSMLSYIKYIYNTWRNNT